MVAWGCSREHEAGRRRVKRMVVRRATGEDFRTMGNGNDCVADE